MKLQPMTGIPEIWAERFVFHRLNWNMKTEVIFPKKKKTEKKKDLFTVSHSPILYELLQLGHH